MGKNLQKLKGERKNPNQSRQKSHQQSELLDQKPDWQAKWNKVKKQSYYIEELRQDLDHDLLKKEWKNM